LPKCPPDGSARFACFAPMAAVQERFRNVPEQPLSLLESAQQQETGRFLGCPPTVLQD